jgi:hypothetical protein
MKRLSSEARNTAALATSTGRPISPAGTRETRWSFIWVTTSVGDIADRCGFAQSRVCKHDVDSSFLPLNLRIEPIQVCKARDVALDRGHIPADPGDRLIQFFLTPPGNKDMRSLRYEFFGRSQSYTAVAASDHGYFIVQFPHLDDPSSFLVLFEQEQLDSSFYSDAMRCVALP